uniref:SJCHGC03125 protein n=1 Tax=Schistosoma japonicum TaxID=6182 RepID=Q3MJV7_SCHJA|nr:SJCHGC03125 protein [Schistosoma japonicum]
MKPRDMGRFQVFDHKNLGSISPISWKSCISNSEVRKKVLWEYGTSIEEVINLHRLRWLGHM